MKQSTQMILAWAVATTAAMMPVVALAQSTTWVRGSAATGRLVYGQDDAGDRLNDFSRAGYMGGGVTLPDTPSLGLPVINVAAPVAGMDQTAAIQAAIDAAANTSMYPTRNNGFRAVVQLQAGTYRVSDSIRIENNSGVILRGAGDTAAGTTLGYTGTQQINMIRVGATTPTGANVSRTTVNASRTDVRFDAKVVPSGSYALPLASVSQFAVGDRILVERPSPLNWLTDIGMRELDNPWGPGNYDQDYERVITAVDRKTNTVMLDTPIPNALQAKYGGAKVAKYNFARTTHVGIENLRGDGKLGAVTPSTDENHANSFIQIDAAENVFVRNVTAIHQIYAAVEAGGTSKHVTVNDAAFASAVSQVTGGRRYSFNQEGQYALMENLSSDRSRHDFVNNSPSRGPNVFLDATATNSNDDSGPHQRWSTGSLFDNVDHQGGNGIRIRDRGNSGSGHGWTGNGFVLWNSRSTAGLIVQSPPTGQNWAIGNVGTNETTSRSAYFASAGVPVTLGVNGETYDSLYRAQVADRLSRGEETIREFTLGDYDGYAAGDAADAAYVDPAWLAVANGRRTDLALVGLDDRTADSKVAFTFEFDLDPNVEHVTSAVLTLALNATGANATSGSQIFADTTDASARVNTLGALPRFASESGLNTDVLTIEFTPGGGVFDLAKLQDGRLNVLLYQRYAVDWANLVITVAPGAVPEPAALGAGLAGLAMLARRRRRTLA